MTPIDAKTQQILDEHTALKESNASHNLRAALAESQMREKCWRTGCIVFFVGFAWQFVWNVVKWM